MDQVVIDKLSAAFGPVSWYKKSIIGFKNEGWFVLEVVPLPPQEELPLVISDIVNSSMVDFNGGKVRHYIGCANSNHNTSRWIKEILPELVDQKFRIAICTGSDDYLMGQPIAIAIEPHINYMLYPDHPHLNLGGFYKGIYIPDSFCYGYTVSPEIYGPTEYDRYINTFDEVTLWLLRHQVWEALRKRSVKNKWIGPHEGELPPIAFAKSLNPFGNCRCGNKQLYINCHLSYDIEDDPRLRSTEKKEIITELVQSWHRMVEAPHKLMLQKLNLMLSRHRTCED